MTDQYLDRIRQEQSQLAKECGIGRRTHDFEFTSFADCCNRVLAVARERGIATDSPGRVNSWLPTDDPAELARRIDHLFAELGGYPVDGQHADVRLRAIAKYRRGLPAPKGQ